MECTCKKISLNELQKNQNEINDTCTLPNHRIYSNHGKDEDAMNVGHANPINTKSDERFIVQPYNLHCKVISKLNLCQLSAWTTGLQLEFECLLLAENCDDLFL